MVGDAKGLRIGVLALQGCVEAHIEHFRALSINPIEVRRPSDLIDLDGLVIPGGESTTMLKLLRIFDMIEPLERSLERIPVWGLCAGLILLSKAVSNPKQFSFGALDIAVARNAYGRQQESFCTKLKESEVAFIRAPQITEVGPGVEVLEVFEGRPVHVRQGLIFGSTFHPELGQIKPSQFHRDFASTVASFAASRSTSRISPSI